MPAADSTRTAATTAVLRTAGAGTTFTGFTTGPDPVAGSGSSDVTPAADPLTGRAGIAGAAGLREVVVVDGAAPSAPCFDDSDRPVRVAEPRGPVVEFVELASDFTWPVFGPRLLGCDESSGAADAMP
ncbi:hypothetical protein ACQ856_23280 [Mycolicibacterium psychrotolerans]|uniref:hypothetical protein n=1 Tax=Mycolicibacterium psychrotolerans TaxID=216929 RepID=UPI003D677FD4